MVKKVALTLAAVLTIWALACLLDQEADAPGLHADDVSEEPLRSPALEKEAEARVEEGQRATAVDIESTPDLTVRLVLPSGYEGPVPALLLEDSDLQPNLVGMHTFDADSQVKIEADSLPAVVYLRLDSNVVVLDPLVSIFEPAGKHVILEPRIAGSLIVDLIADDPDLYPAHILVYKGVTETPLSALFNGTWAEIDAPGERRFDGLSPGRYEVLCERAGSAKNPSSSLLRSIDVIGGKTVVLQVRPTLDGVVRVHGCVLHRGEPVANAIIAASARL